MKAKLLVNLANTVTGQQVADAVQQIAGREYHQEVSTVTDDGSLYQIGQNSDYPYKDIAIGVGPNAIPEVAMELRYDEIYVLSWEYSGEKFAIGYNDNDVVEAVKSFRDKLELALKE